jgi:hypothetical protein
MRPRRPGVRHQAGSASFLEGGLYINVLEGQKCQAEKEIVLDVRSARPRAISSGPRTRRNRFPGARTTACRRSARLVVSMGGKPSPPTRGRACGRFSDGSGTAVFPCTASGAAEASRSTPSRRRSTPGWRARLRAPPPVPPVSRIRRRQRPWSSSSPNARRRDPGGRPSPWSSPSPSSALPPWPLPGGTRSRGSRRHLQPRQFASNAPPTASEDRGKNRPTTPSRCPTRLLRGTIRPASGLARPAGPVPWRKTCA